MRDPGMNEGLVAAEEGVGFEGETDAGDVLAALEVCQRFSRWQGHCKFISCRFSPLL